MASGQIKTDGKKSTDSRQIKVKFKPTSWTIGDTEYMPSISKGQDIPAFKEIDQLIGLDHVKTMMYEIYASIQITRLRSEMELHQQMHVYHMVLLGNPGTGKTTVARIIAQMLQGFGVLQKGHMIEAERADLVGEYIGHTALKTRELVKRALGGILFIDEAYSLARGGEKDFGKEAIDALVKAMEDYKNDFVLVLAGYGNEMKKFLRQNPGLPSRFPIQMDFADYSDDELLNIAESILSERDYRFEALAVNKLKRVIHQAREFSGPFGNARLVRNILEKAMRRQAVRLLKSDKAKRDREALMLLLAEDISIVDISTQAMKQSDGWEAFSANEFNP